MPRSSPDPGHGHARTRAAMARLVPERADAPALADLFSAELDRYAELVLAVGTGQAGFLTRGEDAAFTARASGALALLGMPSEALAAHRALAATFRHTRAFLKLEWDATGPLAACYFRRRPSVMEVLTWLPGWGVEGADKLIVEVAQTLRKRSVHFVAAAFRPGMPVSHKLYFTQLVTPESGDQIAARLAQVFRIVGLPDERARFWRPHHERMVGGATDATVFISFSLVPDGARPAVKLDYRRVSPASAAAWLAPDAQPEAMAAATTLCELAGTPGLSYMGVRLTAGDAAASLKLYCDVP